MMDAVHSYEATVNQVMDDGVMALFGAPLAHEDHAVRGSYAPSRCRRRSRNTPRRYTGRSESHIRSGAYIESATGIREGARTGLAAVTTAALFAISLFFIPLVEPLQQLRFAYGPPRIAVGVLMLESIRRIAFDDLTELVPAFVTITIMVFTYNIANGLTGGLVLSSIMNLLAGRAREKNAGSIVLAVLCLIYYLFGLPHCCRWTSSSAESRRRSCTFTSKVLSSPS